VALAAAVTAPLSSPITRAGQHQAPINAGIEMIKIKQDIKSPFLSNFSPSPFSASFSGSSGAFSELMVPMGLDQAPFSHSTSSSGASPILELFIVIRLEVLSIGVSSFRLQSRYIPKRG